jgi:hypothetical protein
MIWKSEVHDENINDFSLHPPTRTKNITANSKVAAILLEKHNTLLC